MEPRRLFGNATNRRAGNERRLRPLREPRCPFPRDYRPHSPYANVDGASSRSSSLGSVRSPIATIFPSRDYFCDAKVSPGFKFPDISRISRSRSRSAVFASANRHPTKKKIETTVRTRAVSGRRARFTVDRAVRVLTDLTYGLGTLRIASLLETCKTRRKRTGSGERLSGKQHRETRNARKGERGYPRRCRGGCRSAPGSGRARIRDRSIPVCTLSSSICRCSSPDGRIFGSRTRTSIPVDIGSRSRGTRCETRAIVGGACKNARLRKDQPRENAPRSLLSFRASTGRSRSRSRDSDSAAVG